MVKRRAGNLGALLFPHAPVWQLINKVQTDGEGNTRP